MSILYQLPKNPYSGTEFGSASNTFCKQIASSSFISGPGQVFQPAGGAALGVFSPTSTVTAAGNLTNLEVFTTAGVLATSTSSAEGSGMTFQFTSIGDGDTATTINTMILLDPGNGKYVAGDTLTFDLTDNTSPAALAYIATTGDQGGAFGATCAFGAANVIVTLAASTGTGAAANISTTVQVGETGWQFAVDAIVGLTQVITITIPDNGITGDDFAEQDYVVVTNITGGAEETATATVGKMSGSIYHDAINNVEQISLRRSTGSAASTLLAGDVTVRLVKRMLPIN
jgi:hypothetical protein